jgi:phage tail-like protein
MRGPVSDGGLCPVGAAYRISGPVPALYQEDPLFLELCAAFDELLGPFLAALDCFPAYLDPWLAPADFLDWLGTLVGTQPAGANPASELLPAPAAHGRGREPRRRAHIAGAVRAYRERGTPEGLRRAAAAAAGVSDQQVIVAECGSVTWADTHGAADVPAFDPTVEITVTVPSGSDTAAAAEAVRQAAEPALPVFSRLRVKVVEP